MFLKHAVTIFNLNADLKFYYFALNSFQFSGRRTDERILNVYLNERLRKTRLSRIPGSGALPSNSPNEDVPLDGVTFTVLD